MGFRLTWYACRTRDPDGCVEKAGFLRSGEREEFPESPFTTVTLPGGWVLLHATPPHPRFINEAFLQAASRETEAVCVYLHEGMMIASAAYWRNGTEVWTVRSNGDDKLEVSGSPPTSFGQLYAEAMERQRSDAECDYLIDVPISLAKELTGFRHDQDLQSDDPMPFQVLCPAHHRRLPNELPLKDLTLTLESEQPIRSPSVRQIAAGVRWLTPDGGPGFLILEGPGEDYAQTGGGDGHYSVEMRTYSGHSSFRHLVAGKPGRGSGGQTEVATNRDTLAVQEDEVLTTDEVESLLIGWATKSIPAGFSWRDITNEFN